MLSKFDYHKYSYITDIKQEHIRSHQQIEIIVKVSYKMQSWTIGPYHSNLTYPWVSHLISEWMFGLQLLEKPDITSLQFSVHTSGKNLIWSGQNEDYWFIFVQIERGRNC